MTAVDTSVVVPGLLTWHAHHERCRPLLRGARIPAHVLIESYSVLTRLPSPHRVAGPVAAGLLADWFDSTEVLAVPDALQASIVSVVMEAGVEGGAVYDGLIALTCKAAGEPLVTRDQRAVPTYEALGAAVQMLR